MLKRLIIVAMGCAALAMPTSALATTPTPVTITGHVAFGNPGTFATSSGGLCSTGTVTDSSLGRLFATGFQSGTLILFHNLKTFTCDDGSGTFTADLQVMLVFGAPTDSFTWVIIRGTGAYANLHGTGSGVGVEFPGGVDDTYTGTVHFD
jgi:hypothetical protein